MSRMLARYEELIADGQLQADTAQRAAAQRLQQLQDELEAPLPKKTLFERFTGTRSARPDPRGVYMWGGVGRGKSMIKYRVLLRGCPLVPVPSRTTALLRVTKRSPGHGREFIVYSHYSE